MRLITDPRIRRGAKSMLYEDDFTVRLFSRKNSKYRQNVVILSDDFMLLTLEAILLTKLFKIKESVRAGERVRIKATIQISQNKGGADGSCTSKCYHG